MDVGARLGHFEIEAVLGEGGMGVVYLATDVGLGRKVALKTMRPDMVDTRERRARFLREARAAAAITHPNVATVYEVGEDGDVVYIAMEHIDGSSLRDVIAGGGPDLPRAVDIARGIAEALAAAHAVGVIHRDLKPGNVMLDAAGRVKLLDFGLAKTLGAAISDDTDLVTADSAFLGTPAYMAPEQCRGQRADARSDVFSFGTLIYELVSGKRPFVADSHPELGLAIMRDEPEPLRSLVPAVPVELGRVVATCMQKAPGDRYADGAALAAALARMASAPDAEAPTVAEPAPPAPSAPSAPPAPLPWWPYAAGAGAAIAATAWLAMCTPGRPAYVSPAPLDDASPFRRASPPERAVERRITSLPAEIRIRQLAVSADGETYAYDNAEGVYVASMSGGPPQLVPPTRRGHVGPIAFLRDGQHLLVRMLERDTSALGILDVADGTIETIRTATGGRRPVGMMSAALSPDEAQVAFVGERGLQVMGIDGSDERLLVPFAAEEVCVAMAWSPDGSYLAFIRDHWSAEGWDTTLHVVSADGKHIHEIPTQGHLNQAGGVHGLAWPRPGTLVYAASDGARGSRLWAAGVTGGAYDGQPGRELFRWPNASADWLHVVGSRLVFVKNTDIQVDVYTAGLTAAGELDGEPTRLTRHDGDDLVAAWTADGRVLFASDRHGTWDAFAQAPGEARPTVLADGPGSEIPVATIAGAVLMWRIDARPDRDDATCALVRVDADGAETSLLALDRVTYPEAGPPFCASAACAAGAPDRCVLVETVNGNDVVSAFDPRADILDRRPVATPSPGALSPDGGSLARWSMGDRHTLSITDLASGGTREIDVGGLTRGGTSVDWRPDAPGWIATSGGAIYRVPPDGAAVPLWSEPGTDAFMVRVSPDGRHVAFNRRRGECNVWAVDALDLPAR